MEVTIVQKSSEITVSGVMNIQAGGFVIYPDEHTLAVDCPNKPNVEHSSIPNRIEIDARPVCGECGQRRE